MNNQNEQPAAIIDPPRKVKALGENGLQDYQAWGWVKMSANFAAHLRFLKGAKLSVWQCVALNIDESGTCKMTIKRICELTDYSHTEVINSLKELAESGYLSIDKEGKTNIYAPAFVARGNGNEPSVKKLDSTPAYQSGENESTPAIVKSEPTIKRIKNIKSNKADKPPTPPEILLYREVVSKYPNKGAWDEVVTAIQKVSARIGRPAEASDLQPFFKAWCTKSGNLYNFSVWLLEWAVNGTMAQGVKPAQSQTQPKGFDAVRKWLEKNGDE